MRRTFAILVSAAVLVVSCREWDPVFTLQYENPAPYEYQELTPTHTIRELAELYDGTPVRLSGDIVIGGRITTTDRPGNFYKSFFIQDETGGIEIKIGRNSLYNDYKPGQWIYVRCEDLTLGMYGYKSGNYGGQGMLQIGYSDPSGEYETSYMESPLIIDAHIIRGRPDEQPAPVTLAENQLPGANDTQLTNANIGRLVTLRGLRYGGEVFCLLYLDSSSDKKAYYNRVFLSDTNPDPDCDKTHGVTTWAMSKSRMADYLYSGIWDELKVGSGNTYAETIDPVTGRTTILTLGHLRGDGRYPGVEKAAYSVSQYFNTPGGKSVQIRTSGYSKFGDYEIPSGVLDGSVALNVTGILSLYQGSIQLVVNDITDIKDENDNPLY